MLADVLRDEDVKLLELARRFNAASAVGDREEMRRCLAEMSAVYRLRYG